MEACSDAKAKVYKAKHAENAANLRMWYYDVYLGTAQDSPYIMGARFTWQDAFDEAAKCVNELRAGKTP